MKQTRKILAALIISAVLLMTLLTISAGAESESLTVTSYDELVAAIAQGGEIHLGADITASEIIVIDKSVTLVGNGYKIVSTAGRAINVSGADGVTIKNLVIEASGERGINIIQGSTNVVIESVTAKAANYTVNLASSAESAVVTIKNSNLTGLNVVNVAAAGADVTVDNTTLVCDDRNESEGYGALFLNKDAANAKIEATNVVFAIAEGSDSVKAVNAASGGVITIDGSTEDIVIDIAYISYGDYYYGFTDLESAIEMAVKDNKPIVLLENLTLESLEIPCWVEIDDNGYSMTVGETVLKHEMIIDAERVEPSCTQTGTTEAGHCAKCDYSIAATTIPTVAHNYVDGICDCGDVFVDSSIDKAEADEPDETGIFVICGVLMLIGAGVALFSAYHTPTQTVGWLSSKKKKPWWMI